MCYDFMQIARRSHETQTRSLVSHSEPAGEGGMEEKAPKALGMCSVSPPPSPSC